MLAVFSHSSLSGIFFSGFFLMIYMSVPLRNLFIPLVVPETKNVVWALDLMHDTLYYGKPFGALNIIDESNREVLAIEIDTNLPAARVVRTLEQLGEVYGLPQALRLDNGPELRSAALTDWCQERGIELLYIQPGKPSQNAFIERFNRSHRHQVLDAYLFSGLDEVREIAKEWIKQYNEGRPHRTNGNLPPVQTWQNPKSANLSAIRLST